MKTEEATNHLSLAIEEIEALKLVPNRLPEISEIVSPDDHRQQFDVLLALQKVVGCTLQSLLSNKQLRPVESFIPELPLPEPSSSPTTGSPDIDAALRSLEAQSTVTAVLDRLEADAAHRASIRAVLWTQVEEYPRGYHARAWLKALEIISQLDETHPLLQSEEDQLIAAYANDRLEHALQVADSDPQNWWHSEALWREFCARQRWVPEDSL